MHAPALTINLAHLDKLSTRFSVGGRELLATWIYADAPSYKPIGDSDEGIACVDDVARASVAYLDEHARTGDQHALKQARAALEFVMYMQEPDGGFVNFVTDLQGTQNRTHETSRAGLGWWAFRGMWSLARGVSEFAQSDPAFAARLQGSWSRSEQALEKAVVAFDGQSTKLHGRSVPGWLTRFPSDVASVAAIALAQMQETLPNPRTKRLLGVLADGIAVSRVRGGVDGAFDHAAHTTATPELWHAWGAHQGEALARAGRLLGRRDLVEAARSEVEGMLAWQLAAGRVHELTPSPLRAGQQAYGVATAVRGAMEVYRTTGDVRYARIAGLHASWLAGNNMAGGAMYDSATGRGYDGIDEAPRGINRSSGAESTIEAIMALQAIAPSSEARRMARALPVGAPSTWSSVGASEMRAAAGTSLRRAERPITTATGSPSARFVSLRPGEHATFEMQVEAPGEYVLFGSHMRPAGEGSDTTLGFSVGGRQVASLLPRTSSGGDYVALDRAEGAAIHLERGAHQVTVTARGEAGGRPALLAGVVLHPLVARTELALPGGRIEATWALDEARLGLKRID